MELFLWFLLAIAGVLIAGVTKLFIWLTKKDYEKLHRERYNKCSYPCQPCECEGEDTRICDDVDICARKQ